MPLIAKQDCTIERVERTDAYGQPELVVSVPAKCGVVKLDAGLDQTAVRTDSSASQGASEEPVAVARLLFPIGVTIATGDVVEVLGSRLRVTSVMPRTDIFGRLDHQQVDLQRWA